MLTNQPISASGGFDFFWTASFLNCRICSELDIGVFLFVLVIFIIFLSSCDSGSIKDVPSPVVGEVSPDLDGSENNPDLDGSENNPGSDKSLIQGTEFAFNSSYNIHDGSISASGYLSLIESNEDIFSVTLSAGEQEVLDTKITYSKALLKDSVSGEDCSKEEFQDSPPKFNDLLSVINENGSCGALNIRTCVKIVEVATDTRTSIFQTPVLQIDHPCKEDIFAVEDVSASDIIANSVTINLRHHTFLSRIHLSQNEACVEEGDVNWRPTSGSNYSASLVIDPTKNIYLLLEDIFGNRSDECVVVPVN